MSSNLTFLPPIFPLPLLGSPRKSDSPGGKRGLVCARKGEREGKLATRKSEKGKGKDVHGKTNFRKGEEDNRRRRRGFSRPEGKKRRRRRRRRFCTPFPPSLFGKQWSAKKGDPDQFLQVKRGRQWLGAFPLCAFFFQGEAVLVFERS